jgi:hypothetical protein
MRKASIILTAVLASVLTSTATQAKEESSFSAEASTAWWSQYIAPTGIKATDNVSVMHSSLTIFHESGLYFGPWHSGTADHHWLDNQNEWGTETDYTLGWTDGVIDIGASYWDLGKQFDDNLDMVFSYLVLKKSLEVKEKESLTGYLKFANYAQTSGSKNNGNAITGGIQHSIEISKQLSINSDIGAVRNWRVFGFQNSTVARVSSSLSWRIDDHTALAPTVILYVPLEKGGQETEIVGGIVINRKF